jgi:hypothetical protein
LDGDLLQKRDWNVTAMKREGWRKEIGVVMAKKRVEAQQKKSVG